MASGVAAVAAAAERRRGECLLECLRVWVVCTIRFFHVVAEITRTLWRGRVRDRSEWRAAVEAVAKRERCVGLL